MYTHRSGGKDWQSGQQRWTELYAVYKKVTANSRT